MPETLGHLLAQIDEVSDVLVLCGDLTDHGLVSEADALAHDLERNVHSPILAVPGNHDYESGNELEVARVLGQAGVRWLDEAPFEIGEVGFAGAKGFCGGFGRAMLEPWGEKAIKQFVREAVSEARKLELGLAKLRTERRIAVLHYAPIHETVEGEAPEIIPFLGSTHLAPPIDAFEASLALHGHAHHGRLDGRTASGIPVYNCAYPLRARLTPRHPFFLAEI
jgi:Icc-related predicted phosphoesterase